jgi:hypothetical protein
VCGALNGEIIFMPESRVSTSPDPLNGYKLCRQCDIRKQINDEEIIKVYKKTYNVWKTGNIVGLSGQTVHSRLSKIGGILKTNFLTKKDEGKIIEFYKKGIYFKKLKDFAKEIGRTSQFVSRFAKNKGLTNRNRQMDFSVKKSMDERKCIICGKKFIGYSYKLSKKTCSDLCHSKLRGNLHKEWHSKNEHPRGMLWKDESSVYNSKAHREKLSKLASNSMIKRIREKPNSIYSRTKKGWREFDDGKRYYFRSGWEMNYAKYLDFQKKVKYIEDWEYEVDTFWFENIKRGVRSYTPDFKIFYPDKRMEYHEVKGWMDAKSKTKLKRMAKYYPETKIILIDEPVYNAVKKKYGKIVGFD